MCCSPSVAVFGRDAAETIELPARPARRSGVQVFDCRLAAALLLTGGEGIAVASTIYIYGGGTETGVDAPVAFEWRLGGGDIIELFGRIALMTVISCPTQSVPS